MVNQKFKELDIAKGIAIMAVVLGHAFPDSDFGIENQIANFIHSFVYGFHMPVFFFIAGLLSAKHKDDQAYPYIKKRAKKLLIPYFALSLVGLVLKQVFASEANHAFSLSDSLMIPLGQSPMGGMWYLWSLFVMSLIFILFVRFIDDDWTVLLLGVCCHLIWMQKETYFMHNVMNFIVYFMLGVVCKQMYQKLRNLDHSITLCASLPTYYVAIRYEVPELIKGMIGIVMVLSLSNLIENELIEDFGKRSYGIYLMSYFIAIPIRVICYQKLGWNYWLVVGMMFLGGLLIPYGLDQILEKNKIYKKIIK